MHEYVLGLTALRVRKLILLTDMTLPSAGWSWNMLSLVISIPLNISVNIANLIVPDLAHVLLPPRYIQLDERVYSGQRK